MGIDGSQAMLEVARESGLYQDLKQCMLGEGQLPVQWGNFINSFYVFTLSQT